MICKILIGGLRPNFLSVCQPDLSLAQGQGFGGLYYDKSVCTGEKSLILDSLEVHLSHLSSIVQLFIFVIELSFWT